MDPKWVTEDNYNYKYKTKENKMNKKISITERNIFEGEKANPQNCAIARAIKKNMKGKVTSISVLPSHINMKIKNKEYTAAMPKVGADFIKRFDRGQAVNSLSLDLNFKQGYSLI
jgi:hypothetical protein